MSVMSFSMSMNIPNALTFVITKIANIHFVRNVVRILYDVISITVQIRLKKVHECCLYTCFMRPWRPHRYEGPCSFRLSMVKLEKILKLRPKKWFSNTWLKIKTSSSSSSIELLWAAFLSCSMNMVYSLINHINQCNYSCLLM